jgi:acetolactate synthase-1/2/3 large subunit
VSTDVESVAEYIARFVSRAGVRHLFGYPGDPTIELMEAARREDIRFVLATREGTAAFMAEASAMLTGEPGVCLSTLGPGSTALVNGVAAAYLDRVPMLAISGQAETHLTPYFTHQIVDHEALFRPITKWATRLEPASVGPTLRKAWRIAVSERPGPVHVTLHADVGKASVPAFDGQLPAQISDAEWTLHPTASNPALKRLRAARRPVVVAGISAARAGASHEVISLAESLSAPVIVGPMAKGVVPEDHPLFAGTIGMACNALVWDFMAQADVIVAAGFDPVELITPWKVAGSVIHVDAVPNYDQVYAAEHEIIGPIGAALAALAEAARVGSSSRWTEKEVAAHRKLLARDLQAGRAVGRLSPSDVVETLVGAFDPHTVVTVDVGSHKLLVGQRWPTMRPRSFLMTNGLSAMGFSLPAAIVAKLLDPKRTVLCMLGDGGFAMVQGELRTAASLQLAITVVVFCDNSLNRIELKQQLRHYPPVGTRIDATDVVRAAQSMGCMGARVTTVRELEAALSQSRPADQPYVIEARIDPAQYLAQF